MDNNLDEAIRILEELKTTQTPPNEHIFEQLDKLYEMRLEIVELHIEIATAEYESVTAALEDVITEGKEALEDTGKIASTLRKIDKAVGLFKKLIDSIK
ncbi:MAG TPA: hypothetical protein VMX58_12850 [Patescibacteria group bacterium]|nr:hypothetical protein [Patescibacteria group bacterium]